MSTILSLTPILACANGWRVADIEIKAIDPRTSPEIEFPGVAFELTSELKAFGGLSGIAWSGDALYFISDSGTIWRAQAHFDEQGALADLSDWQWAPVRDPQRRRALDLEAISVAPDGRIFVSIEGRHKVYQLIDTADGFDIEPLAFDDILAPSPSNQGIEALTTRDGSSFVGLSEGLLREDGGHAGAFVGPQAQPIEFSYPSATGFDPTDVAWLDDEHLCVLERRYGLLAGWQARIACLEGNAYGDMDRTEVLSLSAGLKLDNFEGLALRRQGDEIRATMVSDDNFLFIQSTYIFDLSLPKMERQ